MLHDRMTALEAEFAATETELADPATLADADRLRDLSRRHKELGEIIRTWHDLAAARRDFPDLVFQGNVDEEILRTGTPEQVAEATRSCLRAGSGRRHIVNLNHGVDKGTPTVNFEAYIRAVIG